METKARFCVILSTRNENISLREHLTLGPKEKAIDERNMHS